MDLTAILALFLARLAGGYALCLGAFGLSVPEGSWRKVSLFVITGISMAALAAGLDGRVCVATGVAALLIERALAYGLAWATLLILPFGLWMLWPPGLDNLPGAVAAGGTLCAMLLGHSYLTARGLSFVPFRRMTLLLFFILIARTALLLPLFFEPGLVMGDWIYLSMRCALGLLLPLLFCWMVIQCVKIQSNQSATGILYAMCALVFLGELIAVYLKLERGLAA